MRNLVYYYLEEGRSKKNHNLKHIPFKQFIEALEEFQTPQYNEVLDIFLKVYLLQLTPSKDFNLQEEMEKISSPKKTLSFIKIYREKIMHNGLVIVAKLKKEYGSYKPVDEKKIISMRADYSLAYNTFNDQVIVQILNMCLEDSLLFKKRIHFLKSIPKPDFEIYMSMMRLMHIKEHYIKGYQALKDLAVLRADPVVESVTPNLPLFEFHQSINDDFSVNSDLSFDFSEVLQKGGTFFPRGNF